MKASNFGTWWLFGIFIFGILYAKIDLYRNLNDSKIYNTKQKCSKTLIVFFWYVFYYRFDSLKIR